MKSYYCFIEKIGVLSPESKVFKVSVGRGFKDQIKLQLLKEYSKDCKCFLKLWCADVDALLDALSGFKPCDKFSVNLGYQVIHVSISQLYKSVVDGCVDALEDSPEFAKNSFRMASTLSPNFFFLNTNQSEKKSVPTKQRKNLSEGECNDRYAALAGFVLVLLLFWLGCLVRSWEVATL